MKYLIMVFLCALIIISNGLLSRIERLEKIVGTDTSLKSVLVPWYLEQMCFPVSPNQGAYVIGLYKDKNVLTTYGLDGSNKRWTENGSYYDMRKLYTEAKHD